jgi:hypothetical protein
MLLKCLPLDTGSLLVSLLCDSMQHEQQPSSFELQSQDYAGTDAASTTSYSNLERLVDQVQAAYNSQVCWARLDAPLMLMTVHPLKFTHFAPSRSRQPVSKAARQQVQLQELSILRLQQRREAALVRGQPDSQCRVSQTQTHLTLSETTASRAMTAQGLGQGR